MVVLGLSAFYHDAAAALIVDGRVVAAAQEERFSRVKHDPSFPRRAIDACLDTAGLTAADVGLVAFYEKPIGKFDRVLETVMATAPRGRTRFVDAMPSWFADKLRVEALIHEHLGHDVRVVFPPHHVSHAAAAFLASPFEEAAILTVDGVGEWATNSMGVGRGARVSLSHELRFPHSLGLLYSAFTEFLGFEVNEGEYKVMGLAPYGTPRYVDVILAHLIDVAADGSYRLNLEHFDFLAGDRTAADSFGDLLGGTRRAPEAELTPWHMDVAASIQRVCEQVVRAQAQHAVQAAGVDRLVMAGGVALNSVANGKLIRAPWLRDLWVQPAAGDAGSALGAALWAWHHVLDRPRDPGGRDALSAAILGPSFPADAARDAARDAGLAYTEPGEDALLDEVAARLARGEVIGWVDGRMEFGPRALGHRSILADPSRADAQRRVNARIKFREGFRPFAPVVPAEDVSTWFELDRPSPYMLLVVPVAEAQRKPTTPEDDARTGLARLLVARSTIPAVTHVDGSARVQTVDAGDHPRFHALLRRFERVGPSPVLLNTSFNLRGEPIVCTPSDAVASFLASGMDALVLGDLLIARPPDRGPTGVRPPAPPRAMVVSPRDLRVFGAVGGAILVLAGWLFGATSGHPAGLAFAAVGVALAIPGLFAPGSLEPVFRAVMPVAKVLGRFNAWVLLSAVYLLVVTPVAVVRRIVSGDPLAAPTGWLPVEDGDGARRPDRMY